MKITVVGTGNMGAAFVKRLSIAGHQVRLVGRNQEKAAALASQFGGIQVAAAGQAAAGADAIVLATGYGDAAAALRSLGDLAGATIIDVTNPLTADYMGLTIGHETSAAEEIAKVAPQAQVVKAFNTVFAQVLGNGSDLAGTKVTVFVASDFERAKQTAIAVAQSMGFVTLDAGSLKNARYLEPLAGLNIYLGYGAGLGTAIAPGWIGV